ncbi:MAG: hypothetical protein NT040_16235 [Bacteroidetes bacterium]|nr:hypothetical protein [Bacteroidota bacterium]
MPANELVKICLQVAKYKKENKELIGYLLFDSNYEPDYIGKVKEEIDLLFSGIKTESLYFIKKNIRRILRTVNKFIKYSGQRQTEVELRLYFCTKLRQSGSHLYSSTSLNNIFDGQMLKIRQAISKLHEDLQHDYNEEIKRMLQD